MSDVLLKLKVPNAGFLADLSVYNRKVGRGDKFLIEPGHFAPNGVTSDKLQLLPKIAAPASTVLLVPKGATPGDDGDAFQGHMMSNIPANTHYVDLTPPDTFVVMSQPSGQTCAALGGIMASRMKSRGAKGIVVGGRVRDLTELKTKHIPVCWVAWELTAETMLTQVDLGGGHIDGWRWAGDEAVGDKRTCHCSGRFDQAGIVAEKTSEELMLSALSRAISS